MNQTGKQSNHYRNTKIQQLREQIINEQLHGNGITIKSFIVNRGHKNGLEIHTITNHGIVLVQNKNTGLLITKLIARPSQIYKYYESVGEVAPKWLIKIARKNYNKNLNK